MNIRADRLQKRLGDAMYETHLVKNSILALTGRRFIKNLNVKSDYEQYKTLMDNAIASSDTLSLKIGVPPTSAKLSLLKKDIVWMETKIINGEKVLVPVVYLAQDYENISGATIMADENINLKLNGNLTNSGLIKASQSLNIDANTITNNSGQIVSNELLILKGKKYNK